jgi:hypothetical protein
MDVSMDGLVHPVREIDVRKYVLVYSSRVLSSVAQRVSSLYAHACCTLSVPGALHEVQISCMWEARHFVMLCDGQSSPKTRRSERQSFPKPLCSLASAAAAEAHEDSPWTKPKRVIS